MVPPEDGCKECSLKLQHLGGTTGAGRPIESAVLKCIKVHRTGGDTEGHPGLKVQFSKKNFLLWEFFVWGRFRQFTLPYFFNKTFSEYYALLHRTPAWSPPRMVARSAV